MRRNSRRALAQETLDILDRGAYPAPAGHTVRIAADLDRSVRDTVLHSPADLDRLLDAPLDAPPTPPTVRPRIEVTAETTLAAARRLMTRAAVITPEVEPLALNFGSAKNPGGGFVNGAQAQEEDLARASGLYASLRAAPGYYDFHRDQRDPLYSDHMIYSPGVPVFRDDAGRLLDEPYPVAFLTSAAPNAGVIGDRARAERLPVTLALRARKVLAAARAHGHRRLVLGAWGCGVFRNDPYDVAAAFADPLRPGNEFADGFEHVVFAVWDRAADSPRRTAFEEVCADLIEEQNIH